MPESSCAGTFTSPNLGHRAPRPRRPKLTSIGAAPETRAFPAEYRAHPQSHDPRRADSGFGRPAAWTDGWMDKWTTQATVDFRLPHLRQAPALRPPRSSPRGFRPTPIATVPALVDQRSVVYSVSWAVLPPVVAFKAWRPTRARQTPDDSCRDLRKVFLDFESLFPRSGTSSDARGARRDSSALPSRSGLISHRPFLRARATKIRAFSR